MKAYWQGAKMLVMQELNYPAGVAVQTVLSAVSMLATYYLWQTAAGGGEIFGYSAADLGRYVVLAAIVAGLGRWSQSSDLAGMIYHGTLNQWLSRPINYLVYIFWLEAGFKIWQLWYNVAQFGLLGWWLGSEWWAGLQLDWRLSSLGLIILLAFNVSVLVSLLSFWWQGNPWSVRFLLLVLVEVLGGSFFPLDIFSGLWGRLFVYQPLAYLVYWPTVWLSGSRVPDWQSGGLLLFWVIASSLTVRFVWQQGLHRYQAFGG